MCTVLYAIKKVKGGLEQWLRVNDNCCSYRGPREFSSEAYIMAQNHPVDLILLSGFSNHQVSTYSSHKIKSREIRKKMKEGLAGWLIDEQCLLSL